MNNRRVKCDRNVCIVSRLGSFESPHAKAAIWYLIPMPQFVADYNTHLLLNAFNDSFSFS